MTTSKTNRGGTAMRGAVAAGAATAVLLGGFGAFALWSDSQNAGAAGQIQTGQLSLDPITGPVIWQLDNPQDGGDAIQIDLATFSASPGDVISYEVPVSGSVTGTDITAMLRVDMRDVVLDPSLQDSDVTVSVIADGGRQLTIVGTEAGTSFTEPVTVRVEFASTMEGSMSLPAAVDIDGLELVLEQQ